MPRDVDGDADKDDLYDAARAAERALGREVSIRRVPARIWHEPGGDPFLASVRSRPLVRLELAAGQPGAVSHEAAMAELLSGRG